MARRSDASNRGASANRGRTSNTGHRPDPIERASLLHDRAVAARAQGQYETAMALARRALTMLEPAVGPDHPDVANVLTTLAGIQADCGAYREVERLVQRAISMMGQAQGGHRSGAAAGAGVRQMCACQLPHPVRSKNLCSESKVPCMLL